MPDIGRVAVADAFRRIILQPNNVTISADDVDDGLTLTAGNFIEFVPNEAGDAVQINASSTISASFDGGNVSLVTNFQNTQAATNTTTGAVRITGGLGVGGAIYASSIQATPVGSITKSTGGFTTLTATGTTTLEGTVTVNGLDVTTSLTPLGTGTVTINPNTAGNINNMNVGASTRGTGAFTTLAANSTTTLTGAVDINGSNVNTVISPTGTGIVTIQPAGGLTINPVTTGNINNTNIGASTRGTGAFTSLDANSTVGLSPGNANVTISPTGTGTVTIQPAAGLTINPTTAGNINNTNIGASTRGTGAFTTLDANSTVGLSPANANVTISPTGTGSVIINPVTVGSIDNINVGASTRGTGAFTTLGANNTATFSGAINFNTTTNSQSYTTTGAGTITVSSGTVGSIDNMNIGASTRGTGAFTTLGANNAVTLSAGANNSSFTTTGAGVLTISSGTVGSIDNMNIGATIRGSGAFTTLAANNTTTLTGAVDINGNNVNTTISPIGTGTVTIQPVGGLIINPTTAGNINNTNIGASTRGTGAFTTLAANSTTNIDTTTNNQSYTTTGAGTITISSGTTGSIDNMSVGATTAATGRFTTIQSTVANGTAPFTVASTTKVDNLQANSASKLHTARNIALSGFITGSASFDGTSDVTINTTSGLDVITLGTSTVGQYAITVGVSGNGLSATTPNAADGTAYTITSNATSANTAGTLVFREAVTGNFSAGTISAAINASTISASSTVTLNPADANISLAPTGTGIVTINPATVGSINRMTIGATTRAAGNFTTLESNGQTRFTANLASTSTTTGTLVVTGGIGASGSIRTLTSVVSGSVSTGGINCNALTFGAGISGRGLLSSTPGYSLVADGFYQFNADTQTDIDISSLLWPFSNGYSYVRISCIALYENDFVSPTARARLHKSWIQGLWYNDATSVWTIEGAALEHGVFNTDSTNFPAGAVNAGKALIVLSGNSVILRFINRNSPSTNSRTSWTYRAEVFYAW